MRWARRFGVLRERDLRLVFSANAISDLGDGVVTVAVTFAVLDLTHSATDIGNGIVSSFGGIVGPAIGGALVVGIGAGSALLVDAASYGASALLLFGVRTHAAREPALAAASRGSFVADLRDGFTQVHSRTWLWATMITMALTNMLVSSYFVLGPVIAKRHLGGPAAWAALSTAFAIGLLVGGGALFKIKPRRPLLVASVACLPIFLPTLLIGIPAPLIVIAAFQVVAGAGAIVTNTMWWTVLQQNIPTELLSRVTSYEWLGTLALQPIGFALAGPLGAALGFGPTLYLCGGLSVVISLGLLAVRDVRALQAVRPVGGRL